MPPPRVLLPLKKIKHSKTYFIEPQYLMSPYTYQADGGKAPRNAPCANQEDYAYSAVPDIAQRGAIPHRFPAGACRQAEVPSARFEQKG